MEKGKRLDVEKSSINNMSLGFLNPFLENSIFGETEMPKEKRKVEEQPKPQPQTQVPFEIHLATWEEFERFGAKKKPKYKEHVETIVSEILKSEKPLVIKTTDRGLILAIIREINRYNAVSQSAKIVYKVSYRENSLIAGVRKL